MGKHVAQRDIPSMSMYWTCQAHRIHTPRSPTLSIAGHTGRHSVCETRICCISLPFYVKRLTMPVLWITAFVVGVVMCPSVLSTTYHSPRISSSIPYNDRFRAVCCDALPSGCFRVENHSNFARNKWLGSKIERCKGHVHMICGSWRAVVAVVRAICEQDNHRR